MFPKKKRTKMQGVVVSIILNAKYPHEFKIGEKKSENAVQIC